MISDLKKVLDWSYQLQNRRWRCLVRLSGEVSQCQASALALWAGRRWYLPLWVSSCPPDGLDNSACLPPAKAMTQLGQEHQLLIYDIQHDGLNPDVLGALGGTLMAGGLLVLLTGPEWGSAPDPDYSRMADYPRAWSDLSAHYLARLRRQLEANPFAIHWQAGQPLRLPTLPQKAAASSFSDDNDCLTTDQAEVVAALVALKRRRPLVITADRGRGKTAALGIACARLLANGVTTLCVTAPRPTAVQPLFERLARFFPDAEWRSAHWLQLASGQSVRFIAPDALTADVNVGEQGGDGSYLFVDEAAAIPAALLGRWLRAFPRIAFATTVHGYEGSGRGFALRFRDQLMRHAPQWREMTLETPVRWASGDPLEATLNDLLLLKAELPACSSRTDLETLGQAALGRDEPALNALFGLLVQSHYRTTPSDVRQLLDGPATHIIVQGERTAPRGVVVARDEGGFPKALAEQVARGKRRPQGHLLAQSLAAHAGCRAALVAKWRRVTRIATHPHVRREGVGDTLLQAAIQQARQDGCDLCGATFGAQAGLLAFWQAAGFTPVRLGISRDTTTGEYAVMVATALTPQGEQVLNALRQRFHASLLPLLAFELKELPADVVVPLLAESPAMPLENHHLEDAQDVAFANRDPRLARGALQALVIHTVQQSGHQRVASALQAVAGFALQNHTLASSHKASVMALRVAVTELLNFPEPGPDV